MQYKSQESAMQAKAGQGKSHSHAPESRTYGAGAPRSTALAKTTAAGALVARARKNVGAANDYVHHQPWKVIGAGAAAGLVLGFLLARRR